MSKLSYWEKRAAQRMFEYMESAEEAAKQIAEVYGRSSKYLEAEMTGMFERYKTKHNLSEKEARKLLEAAGTNYDEILKHCRSNSIDKEVLAKLEAPAYRARIERLNDLYLHLDRVLDKASQNEQSISTEHYINLAETAYYQNIFDVQQRAGYGFSVSKIDSKKIDRIINSKWSGKNYSKAIWDRRDKLAQSLKQELLVNILTGRTERETAQLIAEKLGSSARQARRLVRTESNYIANQMSTEAFKECGVERYLFVAVLDLRTSTICRDLDNLDFPVSEQKVGKNCPPMHPWCRSCIIAYFNRKILSRMKRRARDPKTGKTYLVPADMSYHEWYKRFVEGGENNG